MFLGEHQHNIDEKGRIIMPAKFRESLGTSFIATRGLDNCIFVYPMDEWGILEQKIKTLPLMKADARAFTRFFFAGANECELDKQGRVTLPQNLRDHGRLDKECIVLGVSNRIEIWSKETWASYGGDSGEKFNEYAENLAELGIEL